MPIPTDWWIDPEERGSRRPDPPVKELSIHSVRSVYIEDDDDDYAIQQALEASKFESIADTLTGSSDDSEDGPPITDVDTSGVHAERPAGNEDNLSRTSSSNREAKRHYSVSELVASLGNDEKGWQSLPPALERRIRDFKFAQIKRMERHGENKPWGIFGLYAHLSDIRADLEWAEDAAWRRQNGEPYLSWNDFEKSRDKGLKNRPLFTYFIIFLSTIMLLVSFAVNDWKIEPMSVNPLIGPSSETLIKIGARHTSLIVNDGEWYRLFSPMILHAGVIHYVINMLAMYYIGGAVELSHGFANAAILFVIPAVGGCILSAIFLPNYISVGASGGIFGLIGGCIGKL
jgi:membrane associated rhomboid family serine protease